MKPLTLSEVLEAVNGEFFGSEGYLDSTIDEVTRDSRTAKKGSLFIPLKGANVDGHDFISDVRNKGAFYLSERELDKIFEPYILVESTYQAIKDLAAYYLGTIRENMKVIGIVGSVGKTSTKEMVSSVLSQSFNVLKTEGNYNNEVGVPLTIFSKTVSAESSR